jgi:hypothetical protein
MLTDKQIEQFRILFKKRFGKEISREEAYERGMKLITLMKAVYLPNK